MAPVKEAKWKPRCHLFGPRAHLSSCLWPCLWPQLFVHADSISKVQAVAFALLFLIQECQFSRTFLCMYVYIGNRDETTGGSMHTIELLLFTGWGVLQTRTHIKCNRGWGERDLSTLFTMCVTEGWNVLRQNVDAENSVTRSSVLLLLYNMLQTSPSPWWSYSPPYRSPGITSNKNYLSVF